MCKIPMIHRLNLKLLNSRAKHEVLLLIHVAASEGDPYGVIDPNLEGLERAVEKFDNATLMAHGPGWWEHISADVSASDPYPRGPVRKPGGAVKLLDEYPNVYGDLSAFSGFNAIHRNLKFGRNLLKKLAKTYFRNQPGAILLTSELYPKASGKLASRCTSILRCTPWKPGKSTL